MRIVPFYPLTKLIILFAVTAGTFAITNAGELDGVKIEGNSLEQCKVVNGKEANSLASVQWIGDSKTLFVFVAPKVKQITLSGFGIRPDQLVEVIRRGDDVDGDAEAPQPIVINANGLQSVAGKIKGKGIIIVRKNPEDEQLMQNLQFAKPGMPPQNIEIFQAPLVGFVPAEKRQAAVELKAHGNVFALAIRNGAGIRVNGGGNLAMIKRAPAKPIEPEPISLNGKAFKKGTSMEADFFDEWNLKIGNEDFVLTKRGDGGIQEFVKEGRVFRFLVVGTPQKLEVISEQDSPDQFKSELEKRNIPFEIANPPVSGGRVLIRNGRPIQIINPR